MPLAEHPKKILSENPKNTAAVSSAQKNTNFRNQNPQNTPLIPVCKYAKATPWGMGKTFISNKSFSCSLILGASVHQKIFQIGPTVLALKLGNGRVQGVAQPPWTFLTYFSNHEDVTKLWYGVR